MALLVRAYGFLGVLEGAASMAAFFMALAAGGWALGMLLPPDAPLYRQATTICLATIVVVQMANLFACRSRTGPALARGLLGNPLLAIALLVEGGLIAAIVYSGVGNALFSTMPIPLRSWGQAALLAVGFLMAEELRKFVVRHSGGIENRREKQQRRAQ